MLQPELGFLGGTLLAKPRPSQERRDKAPALLQVWGAGVGDVANRPFEGLWEHTCSNGGRRTVSRTHLMGWVIRSVLGGKRKDLLRRL